ncbi:HEM4 [Candida margitis]|uniref:HEM4 n=1 Tax=Candida margitis TaxID=1775924 RepID=UPI002226A50E|nr:HEM4 [Candida margitis]KAI5950597.1 HEM4 [Candida margitis]
MKNTVILLKNPSTPKDPYHDLLIANSYNPHFIPLLHHTHKDKAQTLAYLTSDAFVENTLYFIITSQRAVEMLRECISEVTDLELRSKILHKVGYTVGPATSKILREVGFTDVRGGVDAGNGSKLAELIMDELSPDTRVVFFTGEIRKDIIPRKLIDVGKFNQFEEFVMYQTRERDDIIGNFNSVVEQVDGGCESTTKDASDICAGGWIVFFSPQGTKEIVQYLKQQNDSMSESRGNKRWKLASIGPTTEEYLLTNGLIPNTIAAKPDAANLVDGILKSD